MRQTGNWLAKISVGAHSFTKNFKYLKPFKPNRLKKLKPILVPEIFRCFKTHRGANAS